MSDVGLGDARSLVVDDEVHHAPNYGIRLG